MSKDNILDAFVDCTINTNVSKINFESLVNDKIYNTISDEDMKVFIRSCVSLFPTLMRITIKSGIEDIYLVESVDSCTYLGSIYPDYEKDTIEGE